MEGGPPGIGADKEEKGKSGLLIISKWGQADFC
jgi:hypothetical protein